MDPRSVLEHLQEPERVTCDQPNANPQQNARSN